MRDFELFLGLFLVGIFVQHVVIRHLSPTFYAKTLEYDRELRGPMLFVIKKCITPRSVKAFVKFLKW